MEKLNNYKGQQIRARAPIVQIHPSRNALCNSACTPLSSVTIPNCSSPTHPSPTSSSYLLNSERKILTQFFSSSGDRRHPPEWGQQHWADCFRGCWRSQPHLGSIAQRAIPTSALPAHPKSLPTRQCQTSTLAYTIQGKARLGRQKQLIESLLALKRNLQSIS